MLLLIIPRVISFFKAVSETWILILVIKRLPNFASVASIVSNTLDYKFFNEAIVCR